MGVDLSAAMLRCAAARGGYTELLCGDLDALLPTMGARRFDLVLATDTLIYYGELQPVLRLIAARLADGGLAAVSLERLP